MYFVNGTRLSSHSQQATSIQSQRSAQSSANKLNSVCVMFRCSGVQARLMSPFSSDTCTCSTRSVVLRRPTSTRNLSSVVRDLNGTHPLSNQRATSRRTPRSNWRPLTRTCAFEYKPNVSSVLALGILY